MPRIIIRTQNKINNKCDNTVVVQQNNFETDNTFNFVVDTSKILNKLTKKIEFTTDCYIKISDIKYLKIIVNNKLDTVDKVLIELHNDNIIYINNYNDMYNCIKVFDIIESDKKFIKYLIQVGSQNV